MSMRQAISQKVSNKQTNYRLSVDWTYPFCHPWPFFLLLVWPCHSFFDQCVLLYRREMFFKQANESIHLNNTTIAELSPTTRTWTLTSFLDFQSPLVTWQWLLVDHSAVVRLWPILWKAPALFSCQTNSFFVCLLVGWFVEPEEIPNSMGQTIRCIATSFPENEPFCLFVCCCDSSKKKVSRKYPKVNRHKKERDSSNSNNNNVAGVYLFSL